ncbi:MAG: RNA polymerase sigma factor [Patescibacteria group bacterium]|nr:RNA polymerase sigma factor [Patescibacteria group bacterium]
MEQERAQLVSDEDLAIKSLANGELFAELMRRFEGRLLLYICRISGFVTEDAEDVLQKVFIKAYFNLRDFDRGLKFSSWIYRIARNETISEWRRRKARPSVYLNDEDWQKIQSESDLFENVHRNFDKEKISAALEQLDEKYRQAIVLYFFEQRSYEEIGDIIQKPVSTVGTLISRAKKQLKNILIK